mmetsp:Transcript_9383/g.14232  ORF Transcript_9383/g.14232 Transcript_9383/m.14232 type:complete len:155 (-) Transcript_9383:58-522(-)
MSTVDSAGRIMIGRGGDLTKSKRLAAIRPDAGTEIDGEYVPSADGWTIFCSNFNTECTADDIQDLFGEYGEIVTIKADFDPITMESRGYFLVKYRTRESADAAVAELNQTNAHGKVINVSFAFRNPKLVPSLQRVEDERVEPRKRPLEEGTPQE